MTKVRTNYNDLHIFMMVAQVGSFSGAGVKLGMAQSNVSRTIKALEVRLGLPLFYRTTRRLTLTRAGEQLLADVADSFDKLDHSLTVLSDYKNTPTGTVRINASLHAIDRVLLPKFAQFYERYPDIRLELIGENRFVDIVADGFDAGVRPSDDTPDDMVAVRISDGIQMAVVATPKHLARYGIPHTPKDLDAHPCISYQMKDGTDYEWHLHKGGANFYHMPNAHLAVNDSYAEVSAVRLGMGLGYVPYDLVQDDIKDGRLVQILPEYGIRLSPLFLYYPHRQVSNALRAVVNYLKVGQ